MESLTQYESEVENEVVVDENRDNWRTLGVTGGETSESGSVLTMQEIMNIIEEEESRLHQDICLNESDVPKEKRGVSSLAEDKEFMKFLKTYRNSSDGGTFLAYIQERRHKTCWDSILNHCCQFVTYAKMKGTHANEFQQIRSASLIESIIIQQPVLFHDFLNHLLRSGTLKPGTIQNRIDSLQYLIEWFRCNSSNDIYYKYSNIIERLKEERNRFQSINRKKNRENSIDALIKKRQWVEEGVEGLQNMMLDSWPYFDALVAFSCTMPLNRQRYSWILCYSLASMWCLAVNARVKSIEKLTMKGFKELQKKKFTLSTSFKTCHTYHYQVVYTTDIVNLYVKYVRRQILPEELDSDEAKVFLTYQGNALAQGDVNKKVKKFFERYGYDLTVTKLREIMMTHVEESSGELTNEGSTHYLMFFPHAHQST